MKPVEFPQMTGVYPVSEKRRTPLPVYEYRDQWNQVVTCWKLTEAEIEEIQKTKTIWIRQLRLESGVLQPILPQIREPIFKPIKIIV